MKLEMGPWFTHIWLLLIQDWFKTKTWRIINIGGWVRVEPGLREVTLIPKRRNRNKNMFIKTHKGITHFSFFISWEQEIKIFGKIYIFPVLIYDKEQSCWKDLLKSYFKLCFLGLSIYFFIKIRKNRLDNFYKLLWIVFVLFLIW